MNKYDDLTITEALYAFKCAIKNFWNSFIGYYNWEIHKCFVHFQKPKYQVGQKITMWNSPYIIKSVYKNDGFIIYDIGTIVNPTESLIDFYNKKEK